MRIAQVAPLFTAIPPRTYGGTERVVFALTEELVRRGHDVTLFATADSRTNARLRSVIDRGLFEKWADEGYWRPEYCHLAAAAEAVARAGEFDLVHFHMGAFSVPLSALTATPVVHSMGTAPTAEEVWTLERFPAAIVTARSRRQLQSIPEPRRASIQVLPNGCDFDRLDFTGAPRAHLAFLGRMCEQKNPVDAILAARHAGMPIILAGEPWDEGDAEYFDERVRPLLGGDATWIGAVDDAGKRDLLARAAALLFPSVGDEAFGLVIIEAMACGAPVLAYDTGAAAETIEPGVTGFVCRDVDEMAARARAATALHPAAVRAAARPRFHLDAFGDRYLKLYNQLIHSATAR